MFLESMNISRIMTPAHHVEGQNIRKQATESKKARTGTMSILSRNRVLAITHNVNDVLWPSLFIVSFLSSRIGMIIKVGNQARSLREEFQAPRPKCGKNHRGKCLVQKEKCFGCG